MSTRGNNQVSTRPATKKDTETQKQNSSRRVVGNEGSNGPHTTIASNLVSCIPCISKETIICKRNFIRRTAWSYRYAGTCGLRLPKRSELSPVRFLKHLSRKIAKGLCFASLRKKRSPTTVSSSGRSKQSVIPVDSHRTEAIEDCIEFINSSSSLPRSNSVSANSS